MTKEIFAHLHQDKQLRPALHPPALPPLELSPDLYKGLLRAIVFQQLSGKAARTIHNRFLALFPDGYPQASLLLGLPDEALRGAGLSRQKVGYLRNVAAFFQEHEADRLLQWTDEELLSALTSIKGVGVWTVQMILLFNLGRPDIFPEKDLGIQKAMQQLYGLEGKGRALERAMAEQAEQWRPYRSYATRLLWRFLDNR